MEVPQSYVDKIRAHYPDLELERLEYVRDGFNNDVVIVNEELVCRFPKRHWGADMLMHEARVLDLVKRHVDLMVPAYEHIERDFVSYPYVPGEPLTHFELLHMSDQDRERVVAQLGRYVRALHAIPRDESDAAGVGLSAVARPPSWWLEFYEQVEETLFPRVRPHQRDLIAQHFAPVQDGEVDLDYEPVFIDGDLAVYHLLYDRDERRVVGKLDFGTAGLGDPAYDLAMLISNYGESAVRAMEPVYPELREHLERARFFAGALELQWAISGIHQDDPWMMFAHLGGVRDLQPVGTQGSLA